MPQPPQKTIKIDEELHFELIKLKYQLKMKSLNEVIWFLLRKYLESEGQGVNR